MDIEKTISPLLRNVSKALWDDAKAQARLEGHTLSHWIQEAITKQLGLHRVRPWEHQRKRLPEQAQCEICGRTILKDGKGRQQMVIHHDEPNDRTPSVAMVICQSCHVRRHRELGWGIGGSKPQARVIPPSKRGMPLGKFKCHHCKRYFNSEYLGGTTFVDQVPKKLGRGMTKGKQIKLCKQCWNA